MREEKKKNIPEIVCVGFVGHTHIENIRDFKNYVSEFPGFRSVFFKVSFDKIWLSDTKEREGSR